MEVGVGIERRFEELRALRAKRHDLERRTRR